MNYYYYPGCTLKTKAKALDASARAAAECLGVTLTEVPEWQCCGAVYPMAQDEVAARLSAVRALLAAREAGVPLVTLCSACHHVIKRVNADMAKNPDLRQKAANYLGLSTPYAGETKVLHYLEVLKNDVGFETIKQQVKHPLTGQKIGAYYGCLLLRPADVMQFDDPESPTMLEDLLRALGAAPVDYDQKNECCAGYLSLTDPAAASRRTRAILTSAREAGAEALVTACPLCQYNLSRHSGGSLPVYYVTELLEAALKGGNGHA